MNTSSKISLASAVVIGMNAMIGAGIFSVPAALQLSAGPAGLITYLFVIAAVFFMAQSLAVVTQRYPQEGLFYTAARQWGGSFFGIIATILYVLGLMVALGLLSRIVGSYLFAYFPYSNASFLGIAATILLGLVVLAGSTVTTVGQYILLALTIFPLVALSVLSLLKADAANLHPFAPYGWTNVMLATRIVIFGFLGFEAIPSLFSRIENPTRNIPKALLYTVLSVGIIYMIFVGSIMLALPPYLFASPETPLATTLLQLYPSLTVLAHAINWSIIITILGTIQAMLWAVMELIVSSARVIGIKKALSSYMVMVCMLTCIAASALGFYNISVMFSIVALLVVCAYGMALLPLLVFRTNTRDTLIGTGGLLTALILIVCAISGLL